MVFQDPMSSLDPVYRIGPQIVEQIRVHDKDISKAQALDRAAELMERVGIPRARDRLRSYPHEFSGGMRQRVMIAMALSCSPQPADRRRADHRARRHDPGPDPRRAAPAAQRDRAPGSSSSPTTSASWPTSPTASWSCTPAGWSSRGRSTSSSTTRSTRTPGGCWARSPGSTATAASRLPAIPGLPPSLHSPPEGCHFRPRCPHAFDRCTRGARADRPPARRARSPRSLLARARAQARAADGRRSDRPAPARRR